MTTIEHNWELMGEVGSPSSQDLYYLCTRCKQMKWVNPVGLEGAVKWNGDYMHVGLNQVPVYTKWQERVADCLVSDA